MPSTVKEFDALISFVALMTCRVPEFFNTMHKLYEYIDKKKIRDSVKTKKSWENNLKKIGIAGEEIKSNINYEKMKQFVEKDNFFVTQSKNLLLLHMFEVMAKLVDDLYKRKWSLMLPRSKLIRFISSDNPVTIIDKNYLPGITNVGFEINNSELVIPLNKNCALVGSFEGDSEIIEAEDYYIAQINMRTLIFATRFIYSTNKCLLLNEEKDDKSTKNYSFSNALKLLSDYIHYEDLIPNL